jgi:hypothetical protein
MPNPLGFRNFAPLATNPSFFRHPVAFDVLMLRSWGSTDTGGIRHHESPDGVTKLSEEHRAGVALEQVHPPHVVAAC